MQSGTKSFLLLAWYTWTARGSSSCAAWLMLYYGPRKPFLSRNVSGDKYDSPYFSTCKNNNRHKLSAKSRRLSRIYTLPSLSYAFSYRRVTLLLASSSHGKSRELWLLGLSKMKISYIDWRNFKRQKTLISYGINILIITYKASVQN